MSLSLRVFKLINKTASIQCFGLRALSSKGYSLTALQQISSGEQNINVRYLNSTGIKLNAPTNEQANILIKSTEKPKGKTDKHDFQAETRMLLDIVARSLYSENEVFVRELISNASDALEKFRYTIQTAGEQQKDFADTDRPLEIHLATEKQNRILTIQDTGIGMTRDELIQNLGTIASSGSKRFMEQIKEKGDAAANSSNIIGQFGVGFYSAFMVANKIEVFTRSYKKDSPGLRWCTDGLGSFEIQEADGVAHGTKIVLHLKPECREYADEDRIRAVIKKYSNFVGSPIYLNGQRANDIQPLWLMEPKDIKPEQHTEFYRYIANTFDKPSFVLHFKTDVPLSIRALIYFPETKPGLFDMARDSEIGVALYTRKILIQSKTVKLIPKWLRFVKGVVDSEDIPLNLSRELLQNSALIKKLSDVISHRIVRFLQERAVKQPEEYGKFYRNYGIFLREGIVSSYDHKEKEETAKLLRFDSSSINDGSMSLEEYCKKVGEEQKEIYYIAAPNRLLAESSPYYESLKKKNVEVLFCYEPYDELVLMQLNIFKGKTLVSVEKALRQDSSADVSNDFGEESLTRTQADDLASYLQEELKGKVANVKLTTRLESHPCVITVEEMATARHFIRTQAQNVLTDADRYTLLQPQLEINPKHPIMKKLFQLRETEPELAKLLTEQLFVNAMVGAGLVDDARQLLTSLNKLLVKALDKY